MQCERDFSRKAFLQLTLTLRRSSAALGVSAALLQRGIRDKRDLGEPADLVSLWKIGLGTFQSRYTVDPGLYDLSLLSVILLANSPQLAVSMLYLLLNGLFTCMLNADEWCRFASQRKSLRVTSPVGKQRSTHYLQLPLTDALPLAALSGLLHWLISQSIFLAQVDWYDDSGSFEYSNTVCGYSHIAVFFAIIAGSALLLGLILNGFRSFPSGMPFAAGCSAAISAACHKFSGDVNASTEAI